MCVPSMDAGKYNEIHENGKARWEKKCNQLWDGLRNQLEQVTLDLMTSKQQAPYASQMARLAFLMDEVLSLAQSHLGSLSETFCVCNLWTLDSL